MSTAYHSPAHRHPAHQRRFPHQALHGALALLCVIAVGIGASVYFGTPAAERSANPDAVGAPATVPTGSPRPTFDHAPFSPGPVSVRSQGFLSWAFLDRQTGRVTGSANVAAPSDTMSMVKAWLVADYLRLAFARDRQPAATRLRVLQAILRDSDNSTTYQLYAELGQEASIRRMVALCDLTDSRPSGALWSNTVVSARDTVRIGLCIADGRAAGPRWTDWVLIQMRSVRGDGDFGLRTALPPKVATTVAVKNGWILREGDGNWHISCLAVGQRWVVGVLARYPAGLGLGYGKSLCRSVGAQLVGG
ncbi:hypothetical protein [Pilimelia columellifera]|uniref:Uncharacterized protein n=1 Tax=Pilimelia columellifera subsp. columellifera TaxID=706583 RepID=A0ABN3NJC9_9ACTN